MYVGFVVAAAEAASVGVSGAATGKPSSLRARVEIQLSYRGIAVCLLSNGHVDFLLSQLEFARWFVGCRTRGLVVPRAGLNTPAGCGAGREEELLL